MKFATIRLSKENDPTDVFDLKYTLIDNTFTKKWINCVLEAQQRRYEISEPWALYNINDKLSDNFVLENLGQLLFNRLFNAGTLGDLEHQPFDGHVFKPDGARELVLCLYRGGDVRSA